MVMVLLLGQVGLTANVKMHFFYFYAFLHTFKDILTVLTGVRGHANPFKIQFEQYVLCLFSISPLGRGRLCN